RHDLDRIRLRRAAALGRNRRGRGRAPLDGHGRRGRDAVRDLRRDRVRAAFLRAVRTPPQARRSAGRRARAPGDAGAAMRGLRLLAALLVLAAGCTPLGPDFQRPEVRVPAQYAEPAGGSGNLPSVPVNWWRLYEDPELDRLVDAGLTRNSDVRLATARIEEAAAVLREAQAVLLPFVEGSVDAGRSRTSERAGASPGSGGGARPAPTVRNNFRIAAGTAFELDFWGRLRRLREAAGADFLASRYGRDAVMQSLSAAVA